MRKVIELQMEFWKKDIANIEFDLETRDEIPNLLMGLQYIYTTLPMREKVFNVLKQLVSKKSHKAGRPGMELWKILVLASLRLNCNWDFDKVHEMANNHHKLRQMLGHSETDFDSIYPLQTIKDNIALLTPPILDKINQIVVKAGHSIITSKKDQQLRGSCDSFVVETDVHYPTDTNLLFDAMRKTISLIAIVYWFKYVPSIRKLEQFDQIMTDYGLWDRLKIKEVIENLKQGIIQEEKELVGDTTHFYAYSDFETVTYINEKGNEQRKSQSKTTKNCRCEDRDNCDHPWQLADDGAGTVVKAFHKYIWGHKASILGLPLQGIPLDAIAVADAATYEGETFFPHVVARLFAQ